MASLVSMVPMAMMTKLHMNIEVKVAKKAFSSINTSPMLHESKYHCNLILTKNTPTTFKKTKLNFQAYHEHATVRILEEVQLGEEGGRGNNSNIHNESGKGNGNGGDSDNYFHHFNNGDDNGIQEIQFERHDRVLDNFNTNFVQAILQEWGAMIWSLLGEVHQDVEMKVLSSAPMMRFLSTNAQSTMTRTFFRMSLKFVSKTFIGCILANPLFQYKLLFDIMVTIACTLWREFEHKRDVKEDWDVVVNILSSIASTICKNWTLAPSQSLGSIFNYEFQKALQKLSNHVFDKSFLLREFKMAKRVLSFVYKAHKLGLFGLVIEALGNVMPLTKGKKVSTLMLSVNRSAWDYRAFGGLSRNFRYQGVFRLERLMQDHFEHLGIVLFFSAILRACNIQIGDASRIVLWTQGKLPIVVHDDDLQAYHREIRCVSSSKNLNTSLFDDIKDLDKDGNSSKDKLQTWFTRRKLGH